VSIALLVGLILGLALAILREQLDNTLKTPEDIEQRLGVTFLGLLPDIVDEGRPGRPKQRTRRRVAPSQLAPELLVHERPTSGIAEAARSLRTNLMFMNPDNPYKRLLVTAPRPPRKDDRRREHRHLARRAARGLHHRLRPPQATPAPHLRLALVTSG